MSEVDKLGLALFAAVARPHSMLAAWAAAKASDSATIRPPEATRPKCSLE